jgi:hypothetical protein
MIFKTNTFVKILLARELMNILKRLYRMLYETNRQRFENRDKIKKSINRFLRG